MLKLIRRHMANRIAFMISLICMSIFVVIGVMVLSFISQTTLQHKIVETELRAEIISKDIRSIFEDARLVTDQLSLHPEIETYLRTAVDKDTIKNNPHYEIVLNTLVKTKESNPLFFLAWVANEKANFYLDSLGIIPGDDYDVKKRPWYDVAVGVKGVAFTPPYVEWGTKKTVISSIKALRDDEGIYGFVVVDIILDSIPTIFKNQKINPTDMNFLIGSDGTYIYHDDPKRIMTARITDEGDPLKAQAGDVFAGISEFKEIQYGGKPYYMTAYSVGENDWHVVTLIDRGIIDGQIRVLGLLTMVLLVLTLLVTITLVYLTVRSATMPYREILTFAEDIAQGDFSRNIPEDFIMREDEMGILGQSFQAITDTFRRENMRLENNLEKQSMELEAQYNVLMETERAAALGNIVAGVAHEINTPIGVSLTTASYLKTFGSEQRTKMEEGKMSKRDLISLMDAIEESSTLLDHNLNRAAELIRNFKQMAVDQSSGSSYSFYLKSTIDSIIVSLHHEYKNLPVRIINNCPEDIRLDSYPGAYSQIITNLIMNSLHHGLPGINPGIITIEVEKDDRNIVLTYKDNGKGIAEENLSKIFDPFFTTNKASGNSGLGMHIIRSLVQNQLNGVITCESSPGNGVIFRMVLPVHLEATV